MQAIVLVGGLGTRLRSIVPNLPKPMAPIHDRPFLAYLLHYLQTQGITHVVLAVHYQQEKIRDYFKNRYLNLTISYVEEQELLGTGGAMQNAFNHMDFSTPTFVLNGDTLVKVNYREMYAAHTHASAKLSLALRHVADCSRYGKVICQQSRIVQFQEKGESGAGEINVGVYLMDPTLFKTFNLPKQFSFEQDFMFPYATLLKPQAFMAEDYFIDIGIPTDYERAQQELPLLFP